MVYEIYDYQDANLLISRQVKSDGDTAFNVAVTKKGKTTYNRLSSKAYYKTLNQKR